MASSDSIFSATNRCHVRSTSMPSSSHPISQRVDENLSRLRQQWDQSSPSSSAKSSSTLCSSLSGLTQLYESLEELLQLAQTQQAFSSHETDHEKCFNEVLEGSVRLLDACGTARDIMMQMIDALKDLQLALRRRRVGEESISTYVSLKKKAVKCLKALKRSEVVACGTSSSPSVDPEVVTVLREARSISITVLESLLSFVSVSKQRSERKSFFLKWVGSGRIACEVTGEKVNEIEKLDASLNALHHHIKSEARQLDVDNAEEQLKATLACMEGLEDALDSLQRRLIQTRVSLLNLLSH